MNRNRDVTRARARAQRGSSPVASSLRQQKPASPQYVFVYERFTTGNQGMGKYWLFLHIGTVDHP